jgi:hypothetical protein
MHLCGKFNPNIIKFKQDMARKVRLERINEEELVPGITRYH